MCWLVQRDEEKGEIKNGRFKKRSTIFDTYGFARTISIS
jgi:hypothetical protein